MVEIVPLYLFRASSDQTIGVNGPTRFAPQKPPGPLSTRKSGLRYNVAYGELSAQLHYAIMGKKSLVANPFIFFTASLICAILHAYKKLKADETGVNIVCLRVASVKTGDSRPVTFRLLTTLQEELEMKRANAHWTQLPLDYDDVFVTTDVFEIPEDSRRILLHDLESAGLHHLIPELDIISSRKNPGLATPLADLRALWYNPGEGGSKFGRDLARERFTIAARLAMAFAPISADHNVVEVPLHILAWFLALRNQNPQGYNLKTWLRSHAQTRTHAGNPEALLNSEASELSSMEFAVPELQKWCQIHEMLQGRHISLSRVLEGPSTEVLALRHKDELEQEKKGYHEFKKRKREEESSGREKEERGSSPKEVPETGFRRWSR